MSYFLSKVETAMWKDILKVGLGIVVGSAAAYALYAYVNKPQSEPVEPTEQEQTTEAKPVVEPVVNVVTKKKVRRTFGKRYSDSRVMKNNPFPADERLRGHVRASRQEKMREKLTDYRTIDILYRLCNPNCTSPLSVDDIRVIQRELAERGVNINFTFEQREQYRTAQQDGLRVDPTIIYKEPEPPYDPENEIKKSFPMPKGYVPRNQIHPSVDRSTTQVPVSIISDHEQIYRTSSVQFDRPGPDLPPPMSFESYQAPEPLTPLQQREQQMRADRARMRAQANQKPPVPLSSVL